MWSTAIRLMRDFILSYSGLALFFFLSQQLVFFLICIFMADHAKLEGWLPLLFYSMILVYGFCWLRVGVRMMSAVLTRHSFRAWTIIEKTDAGWSEPDERCNVQPMSVYTLAHCMTGKKMQFASTDFPHLSVGSIIELKEETANGRKDSDVQGRADG